ncbi:MAG: hypothetical protein GF346_10620, partial [Candidatus Eisenbacteria bacterium]|nr:hypothetical protein [Candidatus Latescibacterota bacterium]MBD3302890.1 hypothetical protein [Candidatus Eisenbacteria bacterium]
MKTPALFRPRPERTILIALLLLCGFGLVMVYSSSAVLGIAERGSSAHFFEQHLIKLLGGLVILVCFWKLDYHHLDGRIARWGLVPVFAALGILAVQHFATDEVCRWFRIGGITIQPSEFARIALVVFLASAIGRGAPSRRRPGWIVVPVLVVLAMAGLVICQPNLSVAIVILGLGFALLYLAGMPIRWLLAGSGIGMLLAGIGLQAYQGGRLAAFWRLLTGGDAGYQLQQSITAVGSGGVIGPGPGSGLQKYFFLPFPHTDFILGIVGEETGLL